MGDGGRPTARSGRGGHLERFAGRAVHDYVDCEFEEIVTWWWWWGNDDPQFRKDALLEYARRKL
jgi:hypothetical protein